MHVCMCVCICVCVCMRERQSQRQRERERETSQLTDMCRLCVQQSQPTASDDLHQPKPCFLSDRLVVPLQAAKGRSFACPETGPTYEQCTPGRLMPLWPADGLPWLPPENSCWIQLARGSGRRRMSQLKDQTWLCGDSVPVSLCRLDGD